MLQPPTTESIAAIRECRLDTRKLFLPTRKLDKKLYAEVKRVLMAMGGEWSTKAQAFVFDYDYAESLEGVLSGRDRLPERNPTAFFPTLPEMATETVTKSTGLLKLRQGAVMLEPSCGRLALHDAALEVRGDLVFHVCEIDPFHREYLNGRGIKPVGDDFTKFETAQRYDGVIMNPPFSLAEDKLAWVTHLNRALDLLAPDGVLIAILPDSANRQGSKSIEAVRARVAALGGIFVGNAKGAFKKSGTGTMAGTCTLYIGGVDCPESRAADAKRAALDDEKAELAELAETTAQIAAIAPTCDHAAIVRKVEAAFERKLIMPNARLFSDLFTSWAFPASRDPAKVVASNRTHISGGSGPYDCRSMEGIQSPALIRAIEQSNMSKSYGIHFKAVMQDDGFTRIFAEYNQIIGGRMVAVVETRSMALSASPVSMDKAA